MLLAAFFGIVTYFIFENSGLKLTTAGMGALIIGTIPVWNLIISSLILKQSITQKSLIGVLLSATGVFILLKAGSTFNFSSLWGNFLILGAAFSWVAYTLLSQPLTSKYNPFSLNLYQTTFGTICLLIFTFREGNALPVFTSGMILNLAFLGMCCSALAYIFYLYALNHLGSTVVTTFINFIPVFGVVGGIIILGESFHLEQLFGGITILFGVMLVTSNRKKITAQSQLNLNFRK